MGIFKTKQGTRHGGEELTASMPLDIVGDEYDGNYFRTMLGYSKHVGKKPWDWYNGIGEIHYAVSRGARIAGYARIYACKRNPDGTPGAEITGGLPRAIADMIQSPFGGTRGLLSRFYTQSKVPGDSLLVRMVDSSGELEGYDFLCAHEIDDSGVSDSTFVRTGGRFPGEAKLRRITSPKINGGEQLYRPLAPGDILGRVWRPDAQYVDMSDSPMLPLQVECELLHLLTVGLKAKLLSRLALNGILFIPSQLNEVKYATADGKSPEMASMTMIDRLLVASTHAVLNYDKPESAVPIMVAGDKELAEAIKFITVDRELYETDMRLRQELIDRILMGLDVQPQDVKGMGDSNHWSAWAVSDDERRVNVQPELETFCWAATRMILHAEMQKAGRSPGTILNTMLWYDLTEANVKTNLAEDARQLRDRRLISPEATRRMSGAKETDKPSEIEEIRQIGVEMGDPYLATFKMSEAENIDWKKVTVQPKPGPEGAATGGKPKVGPGTGGSSKGPTPKSDTPARLRPA